MKPTSRRNFIQKSAKAGVATLITLPSINALMAAGINSQSSLPEFSIPFKTGFDQEPLLYAYNALEPSIDAQTMDIHYNKHAAAYSKNLKEAAVA